MTILSNGHQWKYTEFTDNKNYSFNKKEILNSLTSEEIDDAYKSISKWKGYSPTPLLSLNKLSKTTLPKASFISLLFFNKFNDCASSSGSLGKLGYL